jgi:YcxB-like protein
MEPIQVTFKYTEADYADFNNHYLLKGKGRRMIWLVGAVVLLSIGVNAWTSPKPLYVLATYVIPVVLFFFLWRYFLKKMAGKVFKATPQMFEERQCTIDERGIDIKGETFTATYDWTPELRLAVDKNQLFIFTSAMSAIILPKRVLSAEQQTALTDFFKRKGLKVI